MHTHAREQDGFGLIELLVAMFLLLVALTALVALFASSTVTATRAARISTAAALASSQLERYRAMPWASIELNATEVSTADATYKSEPGSATQVTDPTCAVSDPDCDPVKSPVVGADGRNYRVDSYVFADATYPTRLKRVVVVVRDPAKLTARPFSRQVSSFDSSNG